MRHASQSKTGSSAVVSFPGVLYPHCYLKVAVLAISPKAVRLRILPHTEQNSPERHSENQVSKMSHSVYLLYEFLNARRE